MDDKNWKPPYIDEMMEALERDEVFCCLIFNISWNPVVTLPEAYVPVIRRTLEQFAILKTWTLHRLRVDNDQVFMCLQCDLDEPLENTIKQMQKAAESALRDEFEEIKNTPIWREDHWVETTDKYTLDKCENND